MEEYGEILSLLMNDENKRKNISQSCIESSRKFSLEEVGKKWFELFEGVI